MKKFAIIFTLSVILFFGTFSPATATVNSHANVNSNMASEKIPDRYIVVLDDGFTPQEVAKAHGLAPQFIFKKALNGFAGTISATAAEKLQDDPRVKYVEQDQIYHITGQQLPTGMDRINLENNPLAKVDGVDGPGERNGAVIAVIDTGVDLDHPDLNVDTSYGYECVTLFIIVQCYEGPGYGDDDHNHGTHVAGIAAALDNDIGVVGTAPGATIVPVKVLDATGSGSVMGIVAGVEYVTLKAYYIDVANMSLGGAYSQAINDAVQNSINAGVVYVVAAGNEMVDASTRSPASVAGAITVSAIADFDGTFGGLTDQTKVFYKNAERTEILCTENKDDSVACFSNNGGLVDIAAPGVNILSTTKGNTYSVYSGTSMAAPHVAGAAALIRAQDFGMSPAQVWSELQGMTTPQGSPNGFTEDSDGYPEPLLMVGDNPAPNPIPVANAGTDQNANEHDVVTLDGTLSEDPNFEPLSYFWSQTSGPVVSLDNQTSSSPSFTTPTVFVDTELVFSLVVNDGVSNSVADFVSVFVSNSINEAPIADAGSDQIVNEEELVALDGTNSSDPNSDSLTYLWTQTTGTVISLTDHDTASPTFTA
ncbi:MAG: S8 family serine peptidase, partial [Candidatus Nitrosomaritimum yanchengensis]